MALYLSPMSSRHLVAAVAAAAIALVPARVEAQAQGALALDQALRHITASGRVLVIAAHPDDEDTQAIAWLARGRGVETAYLSLTRGDGGQNLIGNELGEALGAIRTEELLAARRIDGGRQFFTRAFDFGFSKDAEETAKHWPRDTILADVVTVIRAFRPHVIYSVWSGTRADGHGHHEYAGQVAREAFEAAADTTRFPVRRYGEPWAPLKLYGRGSGIRIAASEFDAVAGRTFADLAANSRSQHRSQGFAGVALRSIVPGAGGGGRGRGGPPGGALARERSRVNDDTPASQERSIFDGVDTSFARLVAAAPVRVQDNLEGVAIKAESAWTALNLREPWRIAPVVVRMLAQVQQVRSQMTRCVGRGRGAPAPRRDVAQPATCSAAELDLDAALETIERRAMRSVLAAAQIEVEATAPRELMAFGDSMPVTVAIVNHGRLPVTVADVRVTGGPRVGFDEIVLRPDSGATVVHSVIGYPDLRPWWLGGEREDGYFRARQSPADGLARVSATSTLLVPGPAVAEDARRTSDVWLTLGMAGEGVTVNAGPVVYRAADPLLGVQDRPVGGVPPITLAFDGILEWMPARKGIDRWMRLTVKSYSSAPRTVAMKTLLPAGITLDSLPPTLTLAAGEQREILLRMRGRLDAGRYPFGVYAEDSTGARLTEGFFTVTYPHIRPIHIYRSSAVWLRAVDITVPAGLKVAYIQGVGDASAGYLRQLEVPITSIRPAELPQWDLTAFTTVVLGPRALEADPSLARSVPRLVEFARNGGTLVLQYGQTFNSVPALFPFPMQWQQSSPRVTVEDAPVTVLDPRSRLLNFPNRIGEADWAEWVQERALYMPATIDARYRTPVEMHDPDEPENRGAIVTAPFGRGTFVFTSMSLFRQMPAGVAGGARLFVNLMSAGLTEPPRRPVP